MPFMFHLIPIKGELVVETKESNYNLSLYRGRPIVHPGSYYIEGTMGEITENALHTLKQNPQPPMFWKEIKLTNHFRDTDYTAWIMWYPKTDQTSQVGVQWLRELHIKRWVGADGKLRRESESVPLGGQ